MEYGYVIYQNGEPQVSTERFKLRLNAYRVLFNELDRLYKNQWKLNDPDFKPDPEKTLSVQALHWMRTHIDVYGDQCWHKDSVEVLGYVVEYPDETDRALRQLLSLKAHLAAYLENNPIITDTLEWQTTTERLILHLLRSIETLKREIEV